MTPNLASGVKLNGKLLLKMCGQGSVYIRSLINLDEEASESDEELLTSFLGNNSTSQQRTSPPSDVLEHDTSAPPNDTQVPDSATSTADYQADIVEQILYPENHGQSSIQEPIINFVVEDQENATITGDVKELKFVSLHRTTMKWDILKIFSDPEILKYDLQITFINVHGEAEEGQGIGLSREMLSSFWMEFYTAFSVGVQQMVPVIRHDLQQAEWQAMARVLIYGLSFDYFPDRLCIAFLSSCLFGEEVVTDNMLLSSFQSYVAKDEAEVLARCISDSDVDPSDDEDILEFLSSYKCYKLPTKDNIKQIIVELAHQEIIQKPRYVADCWSQVFKDNISYHTIKSQADLQQLSAKSAVSAKKVVSLLQTNPATDAERASFQHLKRFVKSLEGKDLGILLKLMTGSDVICVNSIEVSYVSLAGLSRRPTFRTCGPLLELPSTYDSYSELSEEFSSIISNAKGGFFDII